jgi:hypothetical protein
MGAAPMMDDKTAVVRCIEHADALSRHFNNEDSLVCVQSVTVFLYRVYLSNFAPKGLPFEDFCEDIGKILAMTHTSHLRMAQAMPQRN